MKTTSKILLPFLVLAIGMPIAYAQDSVLEEVVVTARKRDEALTDIPVSLTAFTAEDIRSAGIETPQDFINLTPNVTLVQTQNAGNSFLNIRGISQARNSEMSAAVLIDGVLMPNPAQFNQLLFDVEQIEVLRGPQGALYGRNAIGGAIVITTKQPTEEFEAKVRLGQLLVSQVRYDEALPLLKRAQELAPRDEVARYVEQVERVARAAR